MTGYESNEIIGQSLTSKGPNSDINDIKKNSCNYKNKGKPDRDGQL
jgi:hypothetical protein